MSGPVITTVVGNIGAGPASIQDTFGGSSPSMSVLIDNIANQDSLVAIQLGLAITQGQAPFAYSWTIDGSTAGLNNAAVAAPIWTPTDNGVFAVAVTVTDANGLISSHVRYVTIGEIDNPLVTIDTINDQSGAAPISLSAVVSGGVGTFDYSWLVNGATTGISNPTIANPTFTPSYDGEHTASLVITDDAGNIAVDIESFNITGVDVALSVSIAVLSNQLDLSTVTLNSTVVGGTGPYTYAWIVDGTTTGLSSSTAADPTYTPTASGMRTAVVTVTDGAGQVAKASVTWRVGNAAGWVCVWNTSGITDHDHKVTEQKTHNGVLLKGFPGATWSTFAWSGGVLVVDTTAGTGGGLTVVLGDALTAPRVDKEIAFTFGLDASLTADNDRINVAYSQFTNNCQVELRRSGGVQQVLRGSNLSAGATINTAGGAQAMVGGMILNRGRTGFKPIYSTSAWSGATGPEPDTMTSGGGTPSGWHSACSLANADTADDFLPDAASNRDWAWMVFGDTNGRQYTVPGIAIWVRHL